MAIWGRAALRQVWWQYEIPWRVQDGLSQWLWFAGGVQADRIGFGGGPLTWARQHRLARLKRDIHIAFLTGPKPPRPALAPLTAWAINNGSARCTASVNTGLDRADIVWIYDNDPLSRDVAAHMRSRLAREARRNVPVINRPQHYNAYFAADAFDRLMAAGVSVPRHRFGPDDIGRTLVVYKNAHAQAAPKKRQLYAGPMPGWRAFAFVDTADPHGVRRRYRAHYVAGMIRPSEAFVSRDWNVCSAHAERVEYDVALTDYERDQIGRIARTLRLDYFAVDFIREAGTGQPYFLDVNVYPTIRSPRFRVRARGDYGLWHTFDARRRLGVAEPDAVPVWTAFDAAMLAFARSSPATVFSTAASQPPREPVPDLAPLPPVSAAA